MTADPPEPIKKIDWKAEFKKLNFAKNYGAPIEKWPRYDDYLYGSPHRYRTRTHYRLDDNGNYVEEMFMEYYDPPLIRNNYFKLFQPEPDPEVFKLLSGANAKTEPKDPAKVRGPEHCNHGFHRPCEVCEPDLHTKWVGLLGGPR